MAIKKINFDKTLAYYLKDKEQYLPCECHTNTYLKFYDYNFPEVERRIDSFKYVTGLLLITDDTQKIAFIHSWIEKNNEVIDMTVLANSFSMFSSIPERIIEDSKTKLLEKVRYMPIISMSDLQFTKECQRLGAGLGFDKEAYMKKVEEYLQSIVLEASKSPAIKKQTDGFGYKYVEGDYSFFLN